MGRVDWEATHEREVMVGRYGASTLFVALFLGLPLFLLGVSVAVFFSLLRGDFSFELVRLALWSLLGTSALAACVAAFYRTRAALRVRRMRRLLDCPASLGGWLFTRPGLSRAADELLASQPLPVREVALVLAAESGDDLSALEVLELARAALGIPAPSAPSSSSASSSAQRSLVLS